VTVAENDNDLDSRLDKVEEDHTSCTATEAVGKEVQALSSKYDLLTKSVNDLSSKIDNLLSQNENLQMEVNSVSEPNVAPTQTDMVPSTQVSQTNATLTILEELADRESQRSNLIVYNLEDSSESKSDDTMFRELCSSVFNLDAVLTKTIRLGRRNDSKPRPLLVCLADISVRNIILSSSGKMRKLDK